MRSVVYIDLGSDHLVKRGQISACTSLFPTSSRKSASHQLSTCESSTFLLKTSRFAALGPIKPVLPAFPRTSLRRLRKVREVGEESLPSTLLPKRSANG